MSVFKMDNLIGEDISDAYAGILKRVKNIFFYYNTRKSFFLLLLLITKLLIPVQVARSIRRHVNNFVT